MVRVAHRKSAMEWIRFSHHRFWATQDPGRLQGHRIWQALLQLLLTVPRGILSATWAAFSKSILLLRQESNLQISTVLLLTTPKSKRNQLRLSQLNSSRVSSRRAKLLKAMNVQIRKKNSKTAPRSSQLAISRACFTRHALGPAASCAELPSPQALASRTHLSCSTENKAHFLRQQL